VNTFKDAQYHSQQWITGGWCLRDDDTPAPPEPDPLSSPQARRAAAQHDEATKN